MHEPNSAPAWRIVALFLLLTPACPQSQPSSAPAQRAPVALPKEALQFGVEWRLIRAGTVKLDWEPGRSDRSRAEVDLDSAGLVAKLYRVEDRYTVNYQDHFCAADILFKAAEGKRQRETRVTFDHSRGKADYLEHDLIKNQTITKQVDVPPCVSDIVGALFRLRTMRLDPGQSAQIPVSDGKKTASVNVEAQDREEIKTPTGNYKTIRYEASIFNDVLYSRKGRMQIWISDDAKRLPVQLRARMQFLIGNITLQLEKIEH